MSYFAIPIFSSQTLSSANTSLTSDQLDIGEEANLAFHCVLSNTTSDISFQLQLSNDILGKTSGQTNWINYNTANTLTSSSLVTYNSIGAQKMRVLLTRNSGSTTVTVRMVAKGLKAIDVAAASWPSGADGALSIDGTVVTLLAGSTKDYSSISIINSGELRIINDLTISNGGETPTIIGCSGNCTINTGGKITANRNAFAINTPDQFPTTHTYSLAAPSGSQVATPSFTTFFAAGGTGGVNGYFGPDPADIYGHGGGGCGWGAAYSPQDDSLWGIAGGGTADSVSGLDTDVITAYPTHFGETGAAGTGVNVNENISTVFGGGGSGGTRGLAGGCFYLQVAGTISVSGVVFEATGQDGGDGGDGGDAHNAGLTEVIGGGGGGGGAGGNGGKIIIRYHAGSSSSANCAITCGSPGLGGIGGTATSDFDPGQAQDGSDGDAASVASDGSTDIASY